MILHTMTFYWYHRYRYKKRKAMKNCNFQLLTMGILFCVSTTCGQMSDYDHTYEDDAYGSEKAAYVKLNAYSLSEKNQAGRTVMKEIRDPQTGMVNMYMPLPANWRITSNAIESPAGSTILEFPGASFTDQQRYIRSIDDLLQQDIPQMIRQIGAQYLRTIDLPEVAQRDRLLGMQYWQALPMEKKFEAKGVEIRDVKGNPALLVVHYTQSRSQYGGHHFYYLHVLSSTDEGYASDVSVLRYALANQQSNPQAVTAYNQNMQQEYIRREQMHAAKMKQAWDHFNAWNSTHVQTWNDISESSLASWQRREAMRDAGQARTVDGILERERLVNPFDGQRMEVDAGYKYYYTNAFGEVIGSNDEFFNPQQDPSLNHQEWRQTRIHN